MKYYFSAFVVVLVFLFSNCHTSPSQAAADQGENLLANEVPQVYYFHYSRRCNTCTAIEEVVSKTIQELYKGKVNFTSLNLDENENESLAKSLKITGQSLWVVYNDVRIDLTNDAFMYARKSPEKLRTSLKEKLDPLL